MYYNSLCMKENIDKVSLWPWLWPWLWSCDLGYDLCWKVIGHGGSVYSWKQVIIKGGFIWNVSVWFWVVLTIQCKVFCFLFCFFALIKSMMFLLGTGGTIFSVGVYCQILRDLPRYCPIWFFVMTTFPEELVISAYQKITKK